MIDITTARKIRDIIEDAFTLEGNRNFLENYNGNQDELYEFLNIAMKFFEERKELQELVDDWDCPDTDTLAEYAATIERLLGKARGEAEDD